MELINIEGITVKYEGGEVLRDASLRITSDDFIGIIGPNGGGKTTFIKAILGLLPIAKGQIVRADKLKVGYMSQQRTLDASFPVSVRELVLTGLQGAALRYRATAQQRAYCDELLTLCNISHLASRQIGALSGGELQRAMLCRSVVSRPELLILDEPTTYVDSGFERNFYDLLSELSSQMAVVMVSHDLGTICSYVQSVACINRTLHYHPHAEITAEILEHYECPLQILAHGPVAHTVLTTHKK